MITARALYGDKEGAEEYVLHNFGGIGRDSKQWEMTVEAVHVRVSMMIADMTRFADGYEVVKTPV